MSDGGAPRGVVILGFPRSGTTLLRRLFDAHPSFCAPPETGVFAASARFLRAERLGDGTEYSVVSTLAHSGFAPSEVTGRVRDLAFSFLDDAARRAQKPRWVEKNPFDVFYAREIEALLGDHVAWVGIVRHGLDAACSARDLVANTGRFNGELHGYVARYARPLEAFAHAWAETTPTVLDVLGRRRHATSIRYEDLVSRPDEVMSEVLAVLGETWPAGLAAQAATRLGPLGFGDWKTYQRSRIESSSVERWRALDRGTVAELAPIVNGSLVRAGYPVVEAGAPMSRDESVRRQQLAMMLQAARGRGEE